ncbi:GAF and ANTAR domain-containing protein [Arthrobacter sp. W4I7]|uniref:GAF and ANTAR domain-containing protein n=1 Tax=Arthrobacter sp. W4I7 TaxID=3042296 RepID=UPI002786C6A8|nr:GAF and ANTAR domain-containing protein [Arthrobacter sp. W4I7]MDQ0691140.1 GAF domain-containing protein [Arthrobacter sp. W4I7]
MDAIPPPAELQDGIASRLQDMVLETSDAEEFFQELAVFSASLLSPPNSKVHCNVTVVRRKKPVTVACSSATARVMDELQYAFGDGPCLTAMRTGTTVYVPDVSREHRWPEYIRAVAKQGVQSILGVPLRLEGESTAALNIYSSRPYGITGEDIARAELFGEQSAKTLRLELRLTRLQEAKDNLEAAMKNRTAIDIAVGVIMGHNRCSQDAAFTILRKASNSRNAKLHDIAAGVIASISPEASLHTYFDE